MMQSELEPFIAKNLLVLGPNGQSVESFLPVDDGNGLSEELFVYGTINPGFCIQRSALPSVRDSWLTCSCHVKCASQMICQPAGLASCSWVAGYTNFLAWMQVCTLLV
ncbi:TPA: hypothetical protein ACH3X1_005135 [Trebouxia sp. C0004]